MWPEDAFFALRVKVEEQPPKVRLLYQDDQRSLSADQHYPYARIYNYPFLRNIAQITYAGQYPFANLDYEDPALPIELRLQAFTPFIPFNAEDSALPAAFFVFNVKNQADAPLDASLLFSMRNCVGYDQDALTLAHRAEQEEGITLLMTAENLDAAQRTYGSLALAVMGSGASCLSSWTDSHGRQGFDQPKSPAIPQLFYPFRDDGNLVGETEWRREIERREMTHQRGELHYPLYQVGWRWRGAVCRKVKLAPGEQAEIVFALSWFFPNHYHYHAPDQNMGHQYANWFADAGEVMRYGLANFPRLRAESRSFCDALYQGLEPWLATSLNAQLTTFPQSFWWTQNGDLSAWEGSCCCQVLPSAHTPWSSFQPLLFFPELYMATKRKMALPEDQETGAPGELPGYMDVERRRRQAQPPPKQDSPVIQWFEQRFVQDYSIEQLRQAISHPRPRLRSSISHEGAAVQVWRDYQWTGDEGYLVALWPVVKDILAAELAQDSDGDGLQDGVISFITYDHWFLPALNCYKASMHLAELQAAIAIARRAGDEAAAEKYAAALQKGAASFEARLWNGEYYNLCYDATRDLADAGCMAEQVSGHLYLRLCGLPPVHPAEHVRAALQAVYRYNRKPEQGLLNGADPRGRTDWRYFQRFSLRGDDEALAGQWVTPWTGTEYYVAATMIAEGLVQEGLQVARDVYERYAAAGMLYNHIECSEHYFRPLDIWAALFALQGLVYDRAMGALAFAPKTNPAYFDTIFILPGVWGRLKQIRLADRQDNEIHVERGALPLKNLSLDVETPPQSIQVVLDGKALAVEGTVSDGKVTVQLPPQCVIKEGQSLQVNFA
jgi:uncharacterized protein (DUF608 family)